MNRAESPYKVNGMDAYHFPIRKELSKNSEGDAVFGIIKGWDQNAAVAYIKICVARRHSLPIKVKWRRHRQADDLYTRVILESRRLKSFIILFEDVIVLVMRISL